MMHDVKLFEIPWVGEPLPVTAWTLVAFVGQSLFAARALVQWGLSERHGRSVTPTSYWWLSIVATMLMIGYSFQRREVPFVLGLAVNLVPYVRNLLLSYRLAKGAGPIGVGLCAAVLAVLVVMVCQRKMKTTDGWFVFGLTGAIIFYSRFLVQWCHSERVGRSEFSMTFWCVSLVGALMLLVYGISRRDVGFIVAYLFNSIPYVRNIMLIRRSRPASGSK